MHIIIKKKLFLQLIKRAVVRIQILSGIFKWIFLMLFEF